MTKPLTDATRTAIVEALEAGESTHRVAKQFGCSAMSVSRIGKAAGVELLRNFPEKAAAARDAVVETYRDYDLAARLELINQFFEKVVNLLATADDPADLQRLTVSLGILIDKRRLEDGDVTSRTETVGDDTGHRIAGKLDDLAERIRAKRVA